MTFLRTWQMRLVNPDFVKQVRYDQDQKNYWAVDVDDNEHHLSIDKDNLEQLLSSAEPPVIVPAVLALNLVNIWLPRDNPGDCEISRYPIVAWSIGGAEFPVPIAVGHPVPAMGENSDSLDFIELADGRLIGVRFGGEHRTLAEAILDTRRTLGVAAPRPASTKEK